VISGRTEVKKKEKADGRKKKEKKEMIDTRTETTETRPTLFLSRERDKEKESLATFVFIFLHYLTFLPFWKKQSLLFFWYEMSLGTILIIQQQQQQQHRTKTMMPEGAMGGGEKIRVMLCQSDHIQILMETGFCRCLCVVPCVSMIMVAHHCSLSLSEGSQGHHRLCPSSSSSSSSSLGQNTLLVPPSYILYMGR
jgi:hypothetical protein